MGRKPKLNPDKVDKDLSKGLSQAEIASKYDVTPTAVNKYIKKMDMAAEPVQKALNLYRANKKDIAELLHSKSIQRLNNLLDEIDKRLPNVEDRDLPKYVDATSRLVKQLEDTIKNADDKGSENKDDRWGNILKKAEQNDKLRHKYIDAKPIEIEGDEDETE